MTISLGTFSQKPPRWINRYIFNPAHLSLRTKKPFPGPIHLHIESSSSCNMSCRFCERSIQTGSQKQQLSLDIFQRILQQFPFISSLDLTGIGEPLCNPELINMIAHARQKNIHHIEFTTNGQLLSADIQDKLLKLHPLDIYLSINATTQKTYSRFHGEHSFQHLTDNVRDFIKRINESRVSIRLSSCFLLTQHNHHEALDFIPFNQEIGIRRIIFRDLIHRPGNAEMSLSADQNSRLLDKLIHTQSSAKNLNVLIEHPLLNKKQHAARPCKHPWSSVYIDSQGDVFPCCRVTQRGYQSRFKIGNILTTSFTNIWLGKDMQKLRNALITCTSHPLCQNCQRYA